MVQAPRPLGWLTPLALALSLALSAPAMAGPGDKPVAQAARTFFQSHMRLAEYHMLGGRYEEALTHFQAVIDKELTLPQKAQGRAEGQRRLRQVKLRAHLGAAVASWKLGRGVEAEALAGAGLKLAEAAGARGPIKQFERFLEDPDEFAERAAPTIKELEERAREAEEALK